MEAWDAAKQANPKTPGITPEGMPSTGKANETLIPDEPAERKTYAMRIIAQRCLYGVDKNPLAVELAKLSLWLTTLAKGRPFGFLDHNFRGGDSLLGIRDLRQLIELDMDPKGKGQLRLFGRGGRFRRRGDRCCAGRSGVGPPGEPARRGHRLGEGAFAG